MNSLHRALLGYGPPLVFVCAFIAGWPLPGAAIGLAGLLGWNAWSWGRGTWRAVDTALLAAFAILVLAFALPVPALARHAWSVLPACLAVGIAASVLLRRPWTTEFCGFDPTSRTTSTSLIAMHRGLSALWAGIFAWLVVTAWLAASPWLVWGPVALGGLTSAFGPRYLMRRAVAARMRGGAPQWPAPALLGKVAPVRVVGAGLGGLTAAALLADAGVPVTVHEQQDVAGGFCHTWLRRASGFDPITGEKRIFRFNSGVHDISGWWEGGPVRSVFDHLGLSDRLDMRRLDHRHWNLGAFHDLPRGEAAYLASLQARHPSDAEGLASLFAEIRIITTAIYGSGVGRMGIPDAPQTVDGMMAFAKAHPFAAEWLGQRWSAFLARHLRDPAAMAAVSTLSIYRTDQRDMMTVAQMVPVFGYFFHGGFYPVGGAGRLADLLVEAIQARGGEVHLGQPVRRILADGGRVSGVEVGGTLLPASAVVLNSDPILAARDLLPPKALCRSVAEAKPSCSAFGVNLGLSGPLDLPPVIQARTSLGAIHMVVPTAVDPSAAPPGYSTLELMFLLPHAFTVPWMPPGNDSPEAIEAWRRTSAYRTQKEAVGNAMIATAEEVIPDLTKRIVVRADASPLTFLRYNRAASGAVYGTDRRNPVKQSLPGLVLAGSAIHGSGVEPAVVSGGQAAEALMPGLLTKCQATPPTQRAA